MRIVNASRVMETTTTTGTGTLTLAGAVAGHQSFAAVGNGERCVATVFAVDGDGIPTGEWEDFIGVYTASGTTLSRVSVLASSNSNNAVSLSAGTKRVILQYSAKYAVTRAQGGITLGDAAPATAGTYDEEFEGTADTLPTDWAFAVAPSGNDATFINSRWPSLLTIEGTANGSYTLTRSNFTPGAGAFGLWARIFCGPSVGTSKCDFRMYLKNAGATEGRCFEIYQPTTNGSQVRSLKTVASAESAWGGGVTITPSDAAGMYIGLTRTAGNVWTAYYSNNGVGWQLLSPQETHSFTVDRIVFTLDTASIQSLVGLDWIRYRADTLFPRM